MDKSPTKEAYQIAEHHRAKLELESPFTKPQLKNSYRKLIRKWHPDRYISEPQAHANATEKAKYINVAYEFLSEFLEKFDDVYRAPPSAPPQSWAWQDIQPKRTYEGKTYTAGFPDSSVTEIFFKSSHIVSTGYNYVNQILYIKFSGNTIYRYFGVPEKVFEDFLSASSHGKFGHQNIYKSYRQERC